MPNHCCNRLTIEGAAAQVRKFVKLVDTHKEDDVGSHFDFMKIYPTPRPLRDVTVPPTILTEADLKLAIAARRSEVEKGGNTWNKELEAQCGMTQEQSDALKKKYGFDNWYDWQCVNWSTKWNSYDGSDWAFSKDKKSAWLFFMTAWSPPKGLLLQAAKMFPKLDFLLEFAEPGMCVCGTLECSDGKLMADTDLGWDGLAARKVRADLLGESED